MNFGTAEYDGRTWARCGEDCVPGDCPVCAHCSPSCCECCDECGNTIDECWMCDDCVEHDCVCGQDDYDY